MGTYTTNYNLFMPSIGEQGWGTLVNGNFSTIDSTMGNLNTRLTAVENEVNGNLSCTSVTTSGTITSAGKITANGGIGTTSLTTSSTITSTGLITANGGIKGNVTGNVTGNCYGRLYINAKYNLNSGDKLVSTCAAQSQSSAGSYSGTTTSTITVNGYSRFSPSFPYKMSAGIYIPSASYLSGSIPTSISRTLTFKMTSTTGSGVARQAQLYVNGSVVSTLSGDNTTKTATITVKNGDTVYMHIKNEKVTGSFSIPESKYYISSV